MFFLVCTIKIYSQSGTLQGKVTDAATGEPMPFVNVALELNGQVITGGMTDLDGKYVIKPIPAGTYDVRVSFVGYNTILMKGIKIMGGKITFQDFKMSPTVEQLKQVDVVDYKVPLISKDQTSSGGSVTDKEIAKMPGRTVESVATTIGGIYSERGEIGSIRGARPEATVYFIDGVKVRGTTSLPKSATSQVDVIMGGIPAKFGDVTGGIISVTTKEPARETHGSFEVSTSKFLDPYNYFLIEGMITGPLFSVKEKDPYDSTKIKKRVLSGYFLTASFNYNKDDAPSVIGWYKAKDGIVEELLRNPYRTNEMGFGTLLNANFLREEAFKKIKAREDAQGKQIMFTGKVDLKAARNTTITIGSTFDRQQGKIFNYANTLFNSNNNGESISNTFRSYIRLTHKFRSQDEKENVTALIKNAYFDLQFDFTKFLGLVQDPRHKDDFFKYGYVGKFKTTKIRSYSWTDTVKGFSSGAWVHDGFADISYSFTPSDINPDLASYTRYYYSLYPRESFMYSNYVLVQAGGGLLNGDAPPSVYGLFNAPGTPFNTYYKINNSQYRISFNSSADIKDHEISLGFEGEMRDDRYFGVSPMALWTLGRAYTNAHIQELDKANPHPVYSEDGVFQDTIWYDRLYSPTSQYTFDKNLRKALGLPIDGIEWIDFDSYDPSIFKINFFSPDELLNNGNNVVTYYGYNAYGKKLKNKVTLNDFLTAKNPDGTYKREIPSFQPIYGAFYIQDKFAFYDLIFNIGLRVDYFDANQMVLKDPYSLYETKKLSEVPDSLNTVLGHHPRNLPPDAVVYADDVANPTKILGYRVGTDPQNVKWYDAYGTQINDPTLIQSAKGMAPILTEPYSGLSVKAFKDYEPQINPMPRIAFSFPISDVALFFAHYDILTKRPSGYLRMDPVQYLYIQNQARDAINNPNLKPEKTIDYELGFQQKLSNTSSLKLSAFYREMRNMIQVQYIYGAYPIKYMTYTNIDFGTVKGMTITYDLRRTGNVSLRLSYTLQFANGTGSNAETSKALIQTGQPNLRVTIPLDFDQRHAITGNIDYRFLSGPLYNGPKWFNKDILQNTGLNITLNYGTGSPYSKRDMNTNYLIGSINGARKPSRFTANARLDRDFEFIIDKEKNKKIDLNVYLEITNLFNNKVILNVYETTGNPDDNGFLTNPANQNQINTQNDPIAFRNYYSMYINYPYNYGFARTIHLGAILSF
ncbi:MAG: carboxypeptidase-like regulatory domain-containing protein [Bacteroidales bacterium]|nr:carboxypeptidase-like regulatory domain-containing protein [Bacteroidales bacterium]